MWPEFQRWCPWGEVVASQRRRASTEWQPQKPFMLAFTNGATLLCGGIEEPGSWEGPNLGFVHFDEARRKRDAGALKVLDGRVRLAGPQGEPPQLFMTTTPRKHWLFDYFGPLVEKDDPFASFKRDSFVIRLLTQDNAANLAAGYVERRRQSLTEAEARVLLEAAWEDIDDVDRFLASMVWWDGCREVLPPLDEQTPLVVAADAGVTGDTFALVGVTRHPTRPDDVAVRYVRTWNPGGKPLDFEGTEEEPGPERELRRLAERFDLVQVTYDAYQLHQMMTRLKRDGVAWCSEFSQQGERLEADKQLFDLIVQRRLAHDGDVELRSHIDNADRKVDAETRKFRLVKRSARLKIDAAVALSMAAARCLKLNL